MSYIDRIRSVNQVDLNDSRPFIVAGVRVGWIRPWFAEQLVRWPSTFVVGECEVRLAPALELGDVAIRTAALGEVLGELRGEGHLPGWRDELYAISTQWGHPPLFLLERAAAPLFGLTGYGVHLNGWCEIEGGLHLWVAVRSDTKPTDPGKLDQLVAGGQPAGLGLTDNLLKECAEEAGISAALARRAVSVGTVTYALSTARGFRPDVLFVFDLETPPDFVPENTDGEVAAFELWPIERVVKVVRETDRFKFNCALVVIDFLVRHGVISPEEADFTAIVSGLRGREQFFARMEGMNRC